MRLQVHQIQIELTLAIHFFAFDLLAFARGRVTFAAVLLKAINAHGIEHKLVVAQNKITAFGAPRY